MSELTEGFFNDLPEFMQSEGPFWQLSLAAAGENRKVQELKAVNINPTQEDRVGILLYLMQQAIISLDITQQAQQEQIQVLITYQKHALNRITELEAHAKKRK